MKQFIITIQTIFNLLADFLYAPFFRAYLREVSLKTSFFPGQNWLLPGLGTVRITLVNDFEISYKLIDAIDDDSIYTVSRKDFYLNCRTLEDFSTAAQQSGKIIPLNFPRNNQ